MSVSSLYQLNEFPTDRDEVVITRIKQHPDMKLITVCHDFALHERLRRLGIPDSQSLNMYDWLQGALDYKNYDQDYDYRKFPRYDKRDVILSPVDRGDKHYISVNRQGISHARINFQPGFVNRTKDVEVLDKDGQVAIKDLYDWRGFLSRRQYFNPDGKLGMELVFHVDGTPVLEISHMADKTMYRLLGTHGLPDWLLSNELSLMLWWYDRILTKGEAVYNDEPILDAVWLQLADRIKLVEVGHVQDLNKDRVKALSGRENVVTPNLGLANYYHYSYMKPWVEGQPVKQQEDYDKYKIAGFGRWITNDQVDQLVAILNFVHRDHPKHTFELFGYFTTDTQKRFKEKIKDLKLDDVVHIRGNLLGELRNKALQNCALAFWWGIGNESPVILYEFNHLGLPVVTNVAGFRGALINNPTANLFAQGINLGINNLKIWRQDVKEHAK